MDCTVIFFSSSVTVSKSNFALLRCHSINARKKKFDRALPRRTQKMSPSRSVKKADGRTNNATAMGKFSNHYHESILIVKSSDSTFPM